MCFKSNEKMFNGAFCDVNTAPPEHTVTEAGQNFFSRVQNRERAGLAGWRLCLLGAH